jgi:hypothetical protein
MCSSYHGPSRSPGGRAAARRVAATNEPYIVSLSSSAGTGCSEASSRPATAGLPDPGGPATTQAGAALPVTRSLPSPREQRAEALEVLERAQAQFDPVAAAGFMTDRGIVSEVRADPPPPVPGDPQVDHPWCLQVSDLTARGHQRRLVAVAGSPLLRRTGREHQQDEGVP